MKAHNSSVQERAYWDTILGTSENNLRRMLEKLNKELRQAHYSCSGDVQAFTRYS